MVELLMEAVSTALGVLGGIWIIGSLIAAGAWHWRAAVDPAVCWWQRALEWLSLMGLALLIWPVWLGSVIAGADALEDRRKEEVQHEDY